jgi:hypothetical protein
MLVRDTCPPRVEGSDPFINTGNGVSIFLKGSQKSVMNFSRICSLAREKFDDYALLQFRVHRMINVRGPEMHCCERPRVDPANLETVRELYGPKMWSSSRQAEPIIER